VGAVLGEGGSPRREPSADRPEDPGAGKAVAYTRNTDQQHYKNSETTNTGSAVLDSFAAELHCNTLNCTLK